MRVLVTGAAGFIGSHLCERLLERGDEVVGLDNLDETLYPVGVKMRTLDWLGRNPKFQFRRGDILDEAILAKTIEPAIEMVVHLAALAGVRPSLEQPLRYQRTNVEGTLRLLEACHRVGVRRFVFASSSSVYGVRKDAAFREEDPCDRPASPYAASKRAAELWVAAHAHLFGLGAIALRFFTVYGPRGRGDMAIAKFARAIDAGEPITLFGDGTTARDYTYIDDIVDGIDAAMSRCQPGAPYRVYNLGNSRPVALLHLVELLEAVLGKRALVRQIEMQPGDVPRTCADLTRSALELGYEPKVTLEDGLGRTVAWLRNS